MKKQDQWTALVGLLGAAVGFGVAAAIAGSKGQGGAVLPWTTAPAAPGLSLTVGQTGGTLTLPPAAKVLS